MNFNRESVFLSAVRSFCNALGAILGVFAALFLAVALIIGVTQSSSSSVSSEMTFAPNAQGSRDPLPPTSPVILRINLKGVIGTDKMTSDDFQNLLYDSLEAPLGKERIRAILLCVNTPGGAATDSATIYQTLMTYKKAHNIPVYAFVDGLCASGGMYVCSAADKIYATSSSVIGSVGVIMGPNFNFSELLQGLGINSLTITQGKDKDALNPFRPWKPNEACSFEAITKDLYEQFVDVVVTGRPKLSRTDLVEEYGANIFLAPKAETLGYIDVSGADYAQALTDLALAAKLEETPYQVVELSPSEGFLAQIAHSKLGLLSGKVEHTLSSSPYFKTELSGKPLYLYQP